MQRSSQTIVKRLIEYVISLDYILITLNRNEISLLKVNLERKTNDFPLLSVLIFSHVFTKNVRDRCCLEWSDDLCGLAACL